MRLRTTGKKMPHRQLLLLLLLAILTVVASGSGAPATASASSAYVCARTGDLLGRLARLVDCYASDPDRVNADGAFGLRVSRDLLAPPGRVRAALMAACGDRDNSRLRRLLDEIVSRQDRLLDRFAGSLGGRSRYDVVTFVRICRPIADRLQRLGLAGVAWKPLGGLPPHLLTFEDDDAGKAAAAARLEDSVDLVTQLIEYDEPRGDACLQELMGRDGCSVGEPCDYFERSLEKSSGYYLTHQLLYNLAEALTDTCELSTRNSEQQPVQVKIPAQLVASCRKIFYEFKQIERANLTRIAQATDSDTVTGLRDLYMEQALLCGLIGIEDFYHRRSMDTVASWQDPELGCFKLFSDSESANPSSPVTGRKILRDVEMLGGCSAHSSGIAMGYYSNAIRHLLKV